MITDLPNPDDYRELAREWLFQSFDIVYDYSKELEYLADWKESEWHFHKGKLATVLVLLHQAIESILKSEIIKVSPFLLIDMPTQSWPSLPNSSDKSYNELFTVNSEALLRLYCATCGSDFDKSELVKLYEEVRIKRNQIVHGLHKEILNPDYLIQKQFEAAREFFQDSFWTMMKREERNHPLYNDLEEDDLRTELYYRIKFVHKYLGPRKFRDFLNIDGRGYLCPECTSSSQDWDFKSVYLNPNSPESKSAGCIICDKEFIVVRDECPEGDCLGNVIAVNEDTLSLMCLTCLVEKD